MKRILLLSIFLLASLIASAQTQTGVVKTKGRMVNGQLVHGQGLKGATVFVQGRTTVVVDADDGTFSFPIPATQFRLDSVRKKGYQIVDADLLKKTFTYSPNPISVIMETPERQLQDELDAERKIRRTMQRTLQQREDELEAMRDQQRLTEEEYRAALQQLYAHQESNEKLIADMARQYAQMDYDQMDELNRRISDAILNGRLTEADSLLRSKGDLSQRISEIRREQQTENQREEEIAQEQADLAEAKVGTQKKLEDAAADCYHFFDLCKLNLEWDSAAYYITLRAELDTSIVEWQYHAAWFCHKQNRLEQAEQYYSKTLSLCRKIAESNPQAIEPGLAQTLNGLAYLYFDTQRFSESECLFKETLEIIKRLAKDNPEAYEPDLALTLNNLGNLYTVVHRLKESEAALLEALEINRRLAISNPQAYEPDLAGTLNNLSALYHTQQLSKCEAALLEALEIRRRLAISNPQAYEPDLASILDNLGLIFCETQRPSESEEAFLEALEIRRRLAKSNPQAYEPDLADTWNNLGSLYDNVQRYTECEAALLEALKIRRRLAINNPQAHEPELAQTLDNLGILYGRTQHPSESEEAFLEALEIRRRLAKNNPQAYASFLAESLHNLAILYYNNQRINECEMMLLESLEINRHLTQANPKAYEHNLALSLKSLADIYSDHQCSECEAMYLEALEIYKRLANDNPKVYELDVANTLSSIGLLYLQEEQFLKAIPIFEESMALYQKMTLDDSSYNDDYIGALYWLTQLYPKTKNHLRNYEVNEQFLVIVKEFYQANTDDAYYQEEYLKALVNQSYQCIFVGRLEQAERYSKEAITIDSTQLFAYTNLGSSLLFQGKFDEAEQIFLRYKEELKDSFLQDLDDFEAAGIIPNDRRADVERIRKLLKE